MIRSQENFSLPEHSKKRIRSFSPHSSRKASKDYSYGEGRFNVHPSIDGDSVDDKRKEHESFAREQTRLNQIQEAEQMREWVSQEDDFVLKQSKKKAQIRVREGRAKFIDWLAVTLSVIDQTTDLFDDEINDSDIDIVDPAGIFEGLTQPQLQSIGKDISTYLTLESNVMNRSYWNALNIICKNYEAKLAPKGPQARSALSVSADVDRLLSSKSLKELNVLEDQISSKLRSNEPIDVEYWEQLIGSIAVYKAKAELSQFYKSIIDNRLTKLKHAHASEAAIAKKKLALLLSSPEEPVEGSQNQLSLLEESFSYMQPVKYSRILDPEPFLKLHPEDKGHNMIAENDFVNNIAQERYRVLKLGYVPPLRQLQADRPPQVLTQKSTDTSVTNTSRFAPVPNEDFSQATTALYEREVARGVQENEEIFAGEEEVSSASKPQWANKYRPRKPRYFNRVQMGYEWNKYNQTHYDHDNPPPKVVQGYKFNIFYPDLINKVKAPTYRIERENGRKRGQSFAPAGEEDTCLIRFISGPPYEDLAFRIVDKEWDYSAKRERGFRSSFDKGILQLHFQFKKVYYRK